MLNLIHLHSSLPCYIMFLYLYVFFFFWRTDVLMLCSFLLHNEVNQLLCTWVASLLDLPCTPPCLCGVLSWAPCTIQQLSTNYFTYVSIYRKILISHASLPPMFICSFCISISLFLPWTWVHLHHLPCDPAISLLGIYPEKIIFQKHTYTPMFNTIYRS